LVHHIPGWVEVMVVGDLGQPSGMQPRGVGVLAAPGLKFGIGSQWLKTEVVHGAYWICPSSMAPFL
jgi:hypothetical protein